MKLQKLFLIALLVVKFGGCSINVSAEDVKLSDEAKAVFEKFKTTCKDTLEYMKRPAHSGTNHTIYASILLGYLHSNALEYNELGILDEVIDTIFNETGIDPNHAYFDANTLKEFSFYDWAARRASDGDEGAKVLFEKFHERGGNSEFIFDETDFMPEERKSMSTKDYLARKRISTANYVKRKCDYYCNWAKTNDKKANDEADRICKAARDIFARIEPKDAATK